MSKKKQRCGYCYELVSDLSLHTCACKTVYNCLESLHGKDIKWEPPKLNFDSGNNESNNNDSGSDLSGNGGDFSGGGSSGDF